MGRQFSIMEIREKTVVIKGNSDLELLEILFEKDSTLYPKDTNNTNFLLYYVSLFEHC
jgi:hypothetical protein